MKKNTPSCNLDTCFLCKQSEKAWVQLIAANKTNAIYKKGTTIFQENKPVQGIYFLNDGIVKVHKHWDNNKELILHFAQKGDMIGYRGLAENKTYPVTATVLETATVCFIELPFFEHTLKANHSLTLQLLKFYINELQEAESRMRNLAHMEVKGRLLEALLHLKQQFGISKEGFIKLIVSRQDLASYVGTTYETLFRTLNELESEKAIRLDGKKIKLLK